MSIFRTPTYGDNSNGGITITSGGVNNIWFPITGSGDNTIISGDGNNTMFFGTPTSTTININIPQLAYELIVLHHKKRKINKYLIFNYNTPVILKTKREKKKGYYNSDNTIAISNTIKLEDSILFWDNNHQISFDSIYRWCHS